MSLSSFLIRIIILVIPGLISSLLYRHLRGRITKKEWEDYLEIIIFSGLDYGLTGLLLYGLGKISWLSTTIPSAEAFKALQAIYDEKTSLDKIVGREIAVASVISIIIAFVASYIDNYKLINRFARHIKATSRFGDEDVWSFFHHSPSADDWVYVRDHKQDLAYLGWRAATSDSLKEREMVLREADVYKNSTGEFLYYADVVYLSRKAEDLTIEIGQTRTRPVPSGEPKTEVPQEKGATNEVSSSK